MKFSVKDFSSKCEQIRSFLWICSHLLKKYLTKKFCSVIERKKIPDHQITYHPVETNFNYGATYTKHI